MAFSIYSLKSDLLRLGKEFVGDENVERIVIWRNFQHYRKRGVIFIHIPKCAGTSISYSIYGQSLGHRRARDLQMTYPEVFGRLYSFGVLRNPVERAISSWRYAINGGGNDGWIRPRPEYLSTDFQDFDRFAQEWLPKQSVETLDFVFQPQSRFVTNDNGQVLVNELFVLDDLESRWGSISDKFDPKIDYLATRNAAKSKRAAMDEGVSKESLDSLRAFYSEDIDLYKTATEMQDK